MTAANPYIRAYQTQQEQTLIVNGETSWDITPAVGLRSIIHFMLDIAAGNTDDWPLPSSPWTRNEDQAQNGALRLLAEVRDPGTSQQTVSIPAAAARDPDTLKTLMIFDLNSEDWKDETTARIRYQALRENTQIPDNVPSSWGHPHHAIEVSPGIQWVYAENESGIMLSPERWNELPPEVQDTMSDPRFARAWPESCIVSALLELESCSDYDLEERHHHRDEHPPVRPGAPAPSENRRPHSLPRCGTHGTGTRPSPSSPPTHRGTPGPSPWTQPTHGPTDKSRSPGAAAPARGPGNREQSSKPSIKRSE